MKFWKKLFGAQRPVETGVAPEPVPDAELEANLLAFIELLTACLAPQHAQRICRAARAAWQDRAAQEEAEGSLAAVDSYQVLEEVMAGEQGQLPGQWLLIDIDWKAPEEIGWQVADILAQRKVQPTWDGAEQEFACAPAAFAALAQWLAQRGLALLQIETQADAYCAFIVGQDQVARARQLAQAARLTLYDAQEFATRNAEPA